MSGFDERVMAARAQIGALVKDAKNPHFRNTYVSLEAAIEQVFPVLSQVGLVLHQVVHGSTLRTTLHEVNANLQSARHLASEYPLPDLQDPQKLAAAVTYARRYSIVTILGLPCEDDDGNTASGRAPQQQARPAPRQTPQEPVSGASTENWGGESKEDLDDALGGPMTPQEETMFPDHSSQELEGAMGGGPRGGHGLTHLEWQNSSPMDLKAAGGLSKKQVGLMLSKAKKDQRCAAILKKALAQYGYDDPWQFHWKEGKPAIDLMMGN